MHKVFTARPDRGDGLDLRSLRFAGEEVISRLYFAVRDEWWRTVPLTIHSRQYEVTPTGFGLEIEAATTWESHPMDVTLRYLAEGTSLVAEVDARARSRFTYRRIGFCLLFPVDAYRGRAATSRRSGVDTAFDFPIEIVTRDQSDWASVRFHRRFDGLDTGLASGAAVRYTFEREEFEFEDQRNWTDASYKAYSTSPRGGSPLSTADGSRVAQRIRLVVSPSSAPPPAAIVDPRIQLGAVVAAVPPVGLYPGRISPRSYRPGGGFQELNSQRPGPTQLAAYDSIELAVNGAVHAADADSVLEATALHGSIVTQVRAAYPGWLVRLAPVSFLDVAGDWRDPAGQYVPEPPPGLPAARQYSEFAATWTIASAAHAIPAGPDGLCYFDAALPADTPAAQTVARLAQLTGRPVLSVRAPAPLAVLAVVVDDAVVVAVANPGPDRVPFRLPGGRDAALDGFAAAWFDLPRPTVPRQPGSPAPAPRRR